MGKERKAKLELAYVEGMLVIHALELEAEHNKKKDLMGFVEICKSLTARIRMQLGE